MRKFYLSILFSICSFGVFSQATYDKFITRLKGGGGGLQNLVTLNFEEGFIRLDETKVTYIRKNIEKRQDDLILYYKDIKSVKKLNYIMVFPWKFVIKMKDGTHHYFLLINRKELIYILRSYILNSNI